MSNLVVFFNHAAAHDQSTAEMSSEGRYSRYGMFLVPSSLFLPVSYIRRWEYGVGDGGDAVEGVQDVLSDVLSGCVGRQCVH